tara:strand:+ start:483 stop:812 length:330 start_codon:yes stop_codon:yes gene_type:complete
MLCKLIKDILQGKPAAKRSPKWESTRNNFIKIYPTCAICGGTEKLEVHHIVPFHIDKEKELDINNLVTLCESSHHCHWTFGHCYKWTSYNPDILTDVIVWNNKIKNRPK